MTIGTLLAAVSTAALLASPAMADKLKIGAAVYGLKAEYMQLWSAALKEHPAVKNGEVDVTVFDGNYTALTQQDQINTMITQKFDAIIFVPIDAEAGVTPVQAAHDAGIPVIGSNTRVNTDLLTSYVGSDDTVSGYLEAKTVLDKIGCKGNVVILEGPIGQSAQISRLEGNKKALAECPDVKVLEDQTANWSRAEAQKLMENWLTAHPGEINGVIGQNDEMALGAIEAIKQAGLDLKNFPTAGIDGISDALRREGGRVDLDPAGRGWTGTGRARPRDLPCRQGQGRRIQAAVADLGAVSRHAVERRCGHDLQRAVDPGHRRERRQAAGVTFLITPVVRWAARPTSFPP